jgi:hypothetical protein
MDERPTPQQRPNHCFGIPVALIFLCNEKYATPAYMKILNRKRLAMLRSGLKRIGDFRMGLAALILGLPLPFVLLACLMRGCNG